MKNNIFLPFDAFERNKKVSSFLDEKEEVLDVGGGVTGIKLFVDNPVKIVDLEVGDIKMDARSLKLPKNSYDVVVSVDVLEHLPQKDRKKFVQNLALVAKKKLIISAPFGSPLHKKAEKKVLEMIKAKNREDFFLGQHVEYGLPMPGKDVYGLPAKTKLFYSGDFRISNFLFRLSHLETGKGIIDRPLLAIKSLTNMLLNIFAFPFWFYETPRKTTNRFYIYLEK